MRRLLFLILTVLGLGQAACVTPVIPLPPPNPESFSLTDFDPATSTVTISGPADPGALVFMFNEQTGKGSITRADVITGHFEADAIVVHDQDQLNFWSSRGTDEATSDVACVVVELTALKLRRGCEP